MPLCSQCHRLNPLGTQRCACGQVLPPQQSSGVNPAAPASADGRAHVSAPPEDEAIGIDFARLSTPAQVIAVLSAAVSLPIGLPLWVRWRDTLPPGRYPGWFAVLPIILVGLLAFGLGALALRLTGRSVFRDPSRPS